MAWYKEWFGADYLDLYSHRDDSEAEEHVDFVESQLGGEARPRPRAVLDLACGAGRHTAALRRRGYRTLGVDLSLTFLAVMAERGLPRVAGDMRRLPFGGATFDWILNFFTSFGYFELERENFLVLEEIVRILTPGGRFLIDLMNPPFVLAHLEPGEVRQADEPGGSEATGGRRVEIERWYDPAAKRVNKRIRLTDPGAPPRCYLESVRLYDSAEVVIGLHWAGLEVDRLLGGFHGKPYDRDSERLIILGHKPA